MDWSGFESLASSKDEMGVWVWAHERFAGGAADRVLEELRAIPEDYDDREYGIDED